jgi:hypothetical protein
MKRAEPDLTIILKLYLRRLSNVARDVPKLMIV